MREPIAPRTSPRTFSVAGVLCFLTHAHQHYTFFFIRLRYVRGNIQKHWLAAAAVAPARAPSGPLERRFGYFVSVARAATTSALWHTACFSVQRRACSRCNERGTCHSTNIYKQLLTGIWLAGFSVAFDAVHVGSPTGVFSTVGVGMVVHKY